MTEDWYRALCEGQTLVTASTRLARHYRLLHAQRRLADGARAWSAPDVLSWSAWVGRLWRRMAETAGEGLPECWSELATQLVWERLIAEDAGETLTHPERVAGDALEAWRLAGAWSLDAEAVAAAARGAGANARRFAAWARAFEAECSRTGRIDPSRQADWLARRLPAMPALAERPVMLLGFDRLQPAQARLLEAWTEAGSAVGHVRLAPRAGRARACGAPDPEAELVTAAEWAAEALAADARRTVGIVVPDLAARRGEVERVVRSIVDPGPAAGEPTPINFSAGYRLSALPLVSAALRLLAVALEPLTSHLASALIREPALGDAVAELGARGRADRALRERGAGRWTLGGLARWLGGEGACPALARRLDDVVREVERWPRRSPPSEWARRFVTLLDTFGWPGERPLDSRAHQTVMAWREQLVAFEPLDAAAGPVGARRALGLLERLCGSVQFQPEAAPGRLEVTGSLEALGRCYDRLWVLGLTADAWPGPARPNPFLPVALQRELAMPHASPAQELAFAREVTAALRASADEVVFSWPCRDGDAELEPSPLLADLGRGDADALRSRPVPDWPARILAGGGVGPFEAEQDVPVEDEHAVELPVTALADQAESPLVAFCRWRLGLRPLERIEPVPTARFRGIVAHRVAEAYARWLARTPGWRHGEAPLPDALAAALEAQLQQAWRPRDAQEALAQRLEGARLRAIFAELLALERARPAFEIAAVETELRLDLAGLRLRGRADRIDRLPDGRVLLIDYKTGSTDTRGWTAEPLTAPQLPAYAAAFSAPAAALAFCELRPGEVRFRSLGAAGDLGGRPLTEEDWQSYCRRWLRELGVLAADYRAGRLALPAAGGRGDESWAVLTRVHELRARHGLAAGASADDE